MVRAEHLHPQICLPILTLFVRLVLGIVILLFFQCIAALFNPVHRRGERVRWGLVTCTVLMFSVVTVYTATYLSIQSISLIDNRDFPGVEGVLPPGPLGYRWFIHSKAIFVIQTVTFFLGGWLADCLMVSSLSDSAFIRPDI